MPRGRPKKSAAQVELLPPEENDQPKVREIKHTTQWIEAVPVEETPANDVEDFEEVEIEDKPKKKNKNAIQEMRKKLRAQGVTPSSSLRIYIERYVHSETDAGGSWAETEFCTKYATTEEHILNKDYIDAARKWGPGKYRITIRMENRIVDAFDERISAPPIAPVVQPINPGDPNSPQVIYQAVDGQQPTAMPTLKDFMKAQREALKEQLEMAKLMREAYGLAPEQPPQQVINPKLAALELLAENPDVMEKIGSGLAKTVLGAKGGNDGDPWAEVAMEAVKNGQAAAIVRTVIDGLFNGFQSFIPKGANNGQAQMATAPLQNQGGNSPDRVPSSEGFPQGQASLPPSNNTGMQIPNMASEEMHSHTATPEGQALNLLIDHCAKQIPPKVAVSRLFNLADAVNEQAPHLSIDGYIELLAGSSTDAVIEYVKTLPGGPEIATLPHAKEWCGELQRLIKESQEGDGE